MVVVLRIIVLIITIALGGALIMWVSPIVRLSLDIMGIKKELKQFKKKWRRTERRFKKDETFRNELLSSPERLSSFFSVKDKISGTDFTRGLQVSELTKYFVANPGVMLERVEEYLHHKKQYGPN